jgi:hypothetical protein
MKDFVPKPSGYEFLQKYARMTDPEEKRKLEEAYDKEVDELTMNRTKRASLWIEKQSAPASCT